jgi:phage terminase small subunit
MKKLTPRQRLFVHEYLVDLNATRAASRAGYSRKTAPEQGARLLKNVKVAAIISRAQTKRAKRLEITADRVTQEVALLAFFDPDKVYELNEGGELTLKSFEDMGFWRRAIAEIKESRVIKGGAEGGEDSILYDKRMVKFHDKSSNLRTLCEYLGILKNQQPALPPNLTVIIERRIPQPKEKK